MLDEFLARKKPLSEEVTNRGPMRLRVLGYVTDETPPLEFVTSARCIVLRGNLVLAQTDLNGTHVWPGARREPRLVQTDVDLATREASRFRAAGGGTIVDATSIGIDRNPAALAQISRVRDVVVGVGDTGIRSGIIGEIGCSWPWTDDEKESVAAVVAVQLDPFVAGSQLIPESRDSVLGAAAS